MSSALYHNQRYTKHLDKLDFGRGRLIFKKVLAYLEPQPEDRILEIGCNRGKILREMKKYSHNAVGIDINRMAINTALTSDIIEMDGAEMTFPANYFDKIYSSHTIEHVPDLNKFIRETARVIKPGGRILLIYPFEIIRGAWFDAIFVYKDLSAARKLHLHKLSPNRIKELIKGTSLRHKKSHIHPAPFLSYFTLLEKNAGA